MPRNVLLLTVDSMRADEVSRPHVDLPALESLIDSGVSFERAFATGPGTTPSFPALLTGTMPLSYGGLGPLTADRPRVSSHFRDAGLTTGGFQSNPFLSRHFD
jgi:arylsulfatase A-like enzyme